MCGTIGGLVVLQAFLRQYFEERNSVNLALSSILREFNFQLSNLSTTAATTIFTVVQIIVLRPIYRYITRRLNNWENHRTWTKYQSSFIVKGILFSSVNNYGFLVYLAIVKPAIYLLEPSFKIWGIWKDSCFQNGRNQCMADLSLNIFSIFTLRQITRQLGSIMAPIVRKKWRRWRKKSLYENIQHKPEYIKDGELEKNSYSTVALHYTNEIIQFGFIVMFSSMNPLGPLVAWFFTFSQKKIDVWDRLCNLQRPFGRSVHSIGSWEGVLRFIVHLGIWTNALSIAFISNGFDAFFTRIVLQSGFIEFRSDVAVFIARLIFVLLYQQIAFTVMMIVDTIPDYPKVVRVGIQSEAYFEVQQRKRAVNQYRLEKPKARIPPI
jgi:hypothetical protein